MQARQNHRQKKRLTAVLSWFFALVPLAVSAQDASWVEVPESSLIRLYPANPELDRVGLYDQVDEQTPGDYAPFLTGTDFYLRSGAMFGLGNGAFEEMWHGGWTIRAGAQWPVLRFRGGWTFVIDVGGGLTMDGSRGFGGSIAANFFTPQEGVNIPVEDGLELTIDEGRFVHAHFAIGTFYAPEVLQPTFFANDPCKEVIFKARTGFRVGRAHAQFDTANLADLQQIVDDRIGLGLDPDQFQITSEADNLEDSDSLIGIFASIGVGVTFYDVHLGSWNLRNVTFGIDLEISHDWFDLGFSEDDGLSGLATLATLSFRR